MAWEHSRLREQQDSIPEYHERWDGVDPHASGKRLLLFWYEPRQAGRIRKESFDAIAPPTQHEQIHPQPLTARAFAQSIVHALFVGRNGRPRGKLGGLSSAQAYDNSAVTEEQVQGAKRWILELRRREMIARQSREQHADPVRLQLLREELAALEIDDPKHDSE
jgi:hypothetical protein